MHASVVSTHPHLTSSSVGGRTVTTATLENHRGKNAPIPLVDDTHRVDRG